MKQITVFIENRKGRLENIAETLSKNNINIICMSLSDTAEFGMLRMIVSQPAAAQEILSANGFSAMLTDVIAVKLPHHFGTLYKMTGIISSEGIDIRYMYALNSGAEAAVILNTSDNEKSVELLTADGFEEIPASVVYNM